MYGIQISHLTQSELLACHHANILFCVSTDSCQLASNRFDFPVFNLDLPTLAQHCMVEVWHSNAPILRRQWHSDSGIIEYSYTPELLFASIRLPLEENTFEDNITQQYLNIFSLLQQENFPVILRMWNYFPAINHIDNNTERYQRFCSGRYRAYTHHLEKFDHLLPAATAIGTYSKNVHIYFIATKTPGINIENPRQISAYQYPKKYGIHSPSFARATYKQWTSQQAHLFLSGTASIVGHKSLHLGECQAQLQETITNIKAILNLDHLQQQGIPVAQFKEFSLSIMKVYLRAPEYLPVVKKILQTQADWEGKIMYLEGDICRQELIVEIEGIWHIHLKK